MGETVNLMARLALCPATTKRKTKIDQEVRNSSFMVFVNATTRHDFLFKNGRNFMCILSFKTSPEGINKSLTEYMPRGTIKGCLTIDMKVIPNVCGKENMAFVPFGKKTHHFGSCSIDEKRLRER